LEVSRLQSSLIPKSTGIVTARELASPPFGCDRASAKDFHEIRAVFTRGVA